jgi:hypothetical protein
MRNSNRHFTNPSPRQQVHPEFQESDPQPALLRIVLIAAFLGLTTCVALASLVASVLVNR